MEKKFIDCIIREDADFRGTFYLGIGEKTYTIDCGNGSDRYVVWQENSDGNGFARIVNWAYGHDDLCNEIHRIMDFEFSKFDSLRDIVKAAPVTFWFLNKVFSMIENG